jgi:hypothetical protein
MNVIQFSHATLVEHDNVANVVKKPSAAHSPDIEQYSNPFAKELDAASESGKKETKTPKSESVAKTDSAE